MDGADEDLGVKLNGSQSGALRPTDGGNSSQTSMIASSQSRAVNAAQLGTVDRTGVIPHVTGLQQKNGQVKLLKLVCDHC